MLNPFMIAGLIMVGVGLLQEAAGDEDKPKLLAGPAGKPGKPGAPGAPGKKGEEGKKGKDALIVEKPTDG